MAYNAKVLEVMIGSPGDVAQERQVVREVVVEWNTVHARDQQLVLLPIGWETHSSPELGGRPQQLINERLLAHADLLVGIFWTRVGSPTGKAASGSIEEIQEHRKQGKPVMLYFSDAPVQLNSVDSKQYEELGNFKQWAMREGLVQFYESVDDFRQKFQRQLQLTLRGNHYLLSIIDALAQHDGAEAAGYALPPTRKDLSAGARTLLTAAADSQNGTIVRRRHLGGTDIVAGSHRFTEANDRRSLARWDATIEQLQGLDLIRDVDGKGSIFQLTDAGYRVIDGET